MNSKQVSQLQRTTNRLCAIFPTGSPLDFSVTELSRGELMLSASNSGQVKWYEERIHVLAIIGPKGGLKLHHASTFVRKMFD